MGVDLDSSVFIQCERAELNASQTLERILSLTGDTTLGLSAITLTELLHAVYRTADPAVRERRETFLGELARDIPVHPYVERTARLAGQIGGQQAALGQNIPSFDLMIGATALLLDCAVLTTNFRHFRQIPNLQVVAF